MKNDVGAEPSACGLLHAPRRAGDLLRGDGRCLGCLAARLGADF